MIRCRNVGSSCHVGVDLTLMIPQGGNGGIKPAILTFLQSLTERFGDGIRLTLLTNSSTYQELDFLVRDQDRMICIAATHGCPWPVPNAAHHNLSVSPEFNPAMLRRIGIDVLYCPFGPTNHSHPDIPTISMVTDLLHRDYPFSIPETERIWREGYFRDILTDAEYVQCISKYTQDKLLEYYPIKKSRVFFTHLPIDQRLQTSGTLPSEYPYFIYPANFWIHKNHEILLIAYRAYHQAATEPWNLVLTGDPGSRSEQVKNLAKQLGIEKHVRFAGHLDETTFAETFAGAGALVYPSLHEGFGIPLVEAMRFGRPIICSKSSSIPEVAGEAAIYVDGRKPSELAAAMCKLAEDSALRNSLVLRGAERLKSFNISNEIDKLYAVFNTAKRSNSRAARWLRFLRRRQKLGNALFLLRDAVKQGSSWRTVLNLGLDSLRRRFRIS
jgi:glycosyltransferase involved in cell wall biosynthesis